MCFVQVLCLHVEGNWGWRFIFVSLLSLCCYCSFTGWIQFESTPPAAIETNRKLQAGLSDWFMYHMVPLIVAPFMVTGGSVPLPLTGASGSAGLLFLRNRNVHSVLTMTHTHTHTLLLWLYTGLKPNIVCASFSLITFVLTNVFIVGLIT